MFCGLTRKGDERVFGASRPGAGVKGGKGGVKRTVGNTTARGFTLVETMIASTLGAVMLSALYACFAYGFAEVRTTREDLRATQIMLKRLERVRLCTFDQVTDTSLNPQSYTESYDPRDQGTGGGGVVYNVTFTPSVPDVGTLPESYRTNMLLVTVAANWTSGSIQHSRSMQSYVAKDGMESYVQDGR